MMKKILLFLKAGLLVMSLFCTSLVFAQIQSAGTGDWNTGSTWVGGVVPGQDDKVIINPTHEVTITNLIYRNAETEIAVGGILRLQNGLQHEYTNPLAFPNVSGVLEISSGGYLTGIGPQYQVDSELRYASGGVYERGIEWGWGADTYKPYHVTIESGTSVNIGANGATNQELEVRGDLTVQANGNLYMDYGTDQMNQPLFVKGNTTVYGQLMLSNNAGGDIKINGDFTFENSGRFFPKARAVIFTGPHNSVHNVTNNNTAVNPFVIPYLVYQPTSGLTTVNLLGTGNYHISAPNGGAVIRHASGTSSRLNIGSRKLTIGTNGIENHIESNSVANTTYLIGSTFSDLELLGIGDLGKINLTTGGRNLKNLIINRNHIGGSAVTFLGGTFAVANQLSLQNGVIAIGVKMILGESATVVPDGGKANSFVISSTDELPGVFQKNIVALNNAPYTFKFPIGDGPNSDDGMQYSPITIDLNKTKTTGANRYITAEVIDKKASPDFDENYLSRHWKIVMNGILNPAYDTTSPFYASDYVGTKMKPSVFYNDTGEWAQQGNNIKITDLTFSTKKLAYTVASTNFHLITAAEKVKKNEINVRGSGITIYSGDVMPQVYDNTDYGTTTTGNTVTKSFKIENLGGKNLNIQNIIIQHEDGTGTSTDFTLLSPNSYTIAADGSVDIQIRFNALAPVGLKKARVYIDNTDSNESDYFYIIQGTVADFMACQGFSTIAIQNFEYSPAVPEYGYTVTDADPDATHIIAGGRAYVGNDPYNKYVGDRSLQVYNASSSIVFNSVDLSTANAPYLSLNLAALGYSKNLGPIAADQVVISVSINGGPWNPQIKVQPSSSPLQPNRFWGFDGAPDFYDRQYSATNPVSAPIVDANFKKNSYRIFNLPTSTDVRIKVEMLSNDLNRIWALDNVMLIDDTSQKTWNGISWSGLGGAAPIVSQKVYINGDYDTGINGSFETCECNVTFNKKLTIAAGTHVNVQNNITNDGEIIVKSDGNLLQINKDAVNTGVIKVRRLFTWSDEFRKEYNYLSSPVKGQNMKALFGVETNTPFVLKLNEATNTFVNAAEADYEQQGKGFAVKEAKTSFVGGGDIANNEGEFKGKPNNGTFTTPITKTYASRGWNLIGNPYPSNLDLKLLYEDNLSVIGSEFRFWDNTVNGTYAQYGGAYQGYSYAIYNAASDEGNPAPGGDPGDNSTTPSTPALVDGLYRYAKVGQGFVVRSSAAAPSGPVNLEYNNNQRTLNQPDRGFFGRNEIQKDRYRLQLITPDSLTMTQTILYIPNGLNSVGLEDSKHPSTNASDAFYSMEETSKLLINAKAPFQVSDKVLLGNNHFTAGVNKIRAVNKIGIFANGQSIYLKDKQLNIITDLTQGDYTFTSEAGVFSDRFEIVYQPEIVLATDGITKASLEVYRDAADFVIRSSDKSIEMMELYDASGRLILSQKGNGKELRFAATRLAEGMYVVKTRLKDGQQLTKKIRK